MSRARLLSAFLFVLLLTVSPAKILPAFAEEGSPERIRTIPVGDLEKPASRRPISDSGDDSRVRFLPRLRNKLVLSPQPDLMNYPIVTYIDPKFTQWATSAASTGPGSPVESGDNSVAGKSGEDIELTIGDLHGNALKLVYFLVREGIMLLTADHYRTLARIYVAGGFTPNGSIDRAAILEFSAIIKNAEVNTPSALDREIRGDRGIRPIRPVQMFRLIGDELGDRGMNDYFTMKVLARLHEEKAPFEILLSNHGLEFIKFFEEQIAKDSGQIYQNILGFGQARSLVNLQKLVGRGKTTAENEYVQEIKQFYENVYLPHLKIVSYSVEAAPESPPELSFYSHAPVGLEALPEMAKSFSVSGSACQSDEIHTTATKLRICIDAINQRFSQMIKAHALGERFYQETGAYGLRETNPRSPISYVTWNRNLSRLDRPVKLRDQTALTFVHGHDGGATSGNTHVGNRVNLDNLLGRVPYPLNEPSLTRSAMYGFYETH